MHRLANETNGRYASRVNELPDDARAALDRARAQKISYAVRTLRAPDGRILVVLGEAHIKLAKAEEIGRAVVASFELRGVETFQRKDVALGRALGVLIEMPRRLLRLASLGAVRGSTIVEAKQLPSGYTVELERTKKVPFGLHVASVYLTAFMTVGVLATLARLVDLPPLLSVPIVLAVAAFDLHMLLLVPAILLRRQPWCWMIHPLLGILTIRDALMAEGTVRMLADHPREKAAVVVMGRAHVSGFTRLLIEKYGFTAV